MKGKAGLSTSLGMTVFVVVHAFAGKNTRNTRSEAYEDWFWLEADAPDILYSILNVVL